MTGRIRTPRVGAVWTSLLILILPSASSAQSVLPPEDARLVHALRSYIPHAMRLYGTPGLNIALGRRGEVIWEEGFGFSDLGRRTPMTARTVHDPAPWGRRTRPLPFCSSWSAVFSSWTPRSIGT